jgi:hypothetical protein
MTPQDLSDIDRQVAEAIGLEYEMLQPAYLDSPACFLESRREFRPSTDWRDAMFAAEKAGLFMGDGATIYQRDDKFWAIGFAGSTKLLMDESGPLCVARAILKLKGGK